jgi:hypothetical protein
MKFLSLFLFVGAALAFPLAEDAKANSTACSAEQNKLAGELARGIQANLDIQTQELAG